VATPSGEVSRRAAVSRHQPENDRQRVCRLGAQVAAQRQAIGIRQHRVEHDQIDRVPVELLPHLASIACSKRFETVAHQVVDE